MGNMTHQAKAKIRERVESARKWGSFSVNISLLGVVLAFVLPKLDFVYLQAQKIEPLQQQVQTNTKGIEENKGHLAKHDIEIAIIKARGRNSADAVAQENVSLVTTKPGFIP